MSRQVTVEIPADELAALQLLLTKMPASAALETLRLLRAELVEKVAEKERAIAELERMLAVAGRAVRRLS